MTDLFNSNPSNDFVNPNLAPCPGQADSYLFEFLPNQSVGIISGSSIIASMGLGEISLAVQGWVQQTKILQPGEVTFVQGLTKGISNKSQRFIFDGSVAYDGANHSLYMSADLSINYYKNFRYYQNSIHATSDVNNGIDIEVALNMAFDAYGIGVTASYDSSTISFSGDTAGYAFDITTIDVSLFEPLQSVVGKPLTEDASAGIPAFIYPNTAMLGYVLKLTYPSTAGDVNEFIDINHVPNSFTYYVQNDPSCWSRYTKTIDKIGRAHV